MILLMRMAIDDQLLAAKFRRIAASGVGHTKYFKAISRRAIENARRERVAGQVAFRLP